MRVFGVRFDERGAPPRTNIERIANVLINVLTTALYLNPARDSKTATRYALHPPKSSEDLGMYYIAMLIQKLQNVHISQANR